MIDPELYSHASTQARKLLERAATPAYLITAKDPLTQEEADKLAEVFREKVRNHRLEVYRPEDEDDVIVTPASVYVDPFPLIHAAQAWATLALAAAQPAQRNDDNRFVNERDHTWRSGRTGGM